MAFHLLRQRAGPYAAVLENLQEPAHFWLLRLPRRRDEPGEVHEQIHQGAYKRANVNVVSSAIS